MSQTDTAVELLGKVDFALRRDLEAKDQMIAYQESRIGQLEKALRRQRDEFQVDEAKERRDHETKMARVIGENIQLLADVEQAAAERNAAIEKSARLQAENDWLRRRQAQDEAAKEALAREVMQLRTERDAATYQLLNSEAEKDRDNVTIPIEKICPRCKCNTTQWTKQGWYCQGCDELYDPQY